MAWHQRNENGDNNIDCIDNSHRKTHSDIYREEKR
jgi:hypothetical protein